MNTSAQKTLSVLIKEQANKLNFDLCGIAASAILDEHKPVIYEWCSSGMNGEMDYLCRNIEKRINPELLFTGAKSIIVTGLNYYTEKKQVGNSIPVISRYAYGDNYHDVIQGKLRRLLDYIIKIRPDAEGRSFVDSAPLLEKAWAREAGLGWPGRHSILINNKIGSFFFIGVIILNLELDYDNRFNKDLCGTCRLCIEACPTAAINENRTIDVRKCISYLTVESKAPVPDDLILKMEGRVFGCDRCQEVCPWNKNSKPHKTPEFVMSEELEHMSGREWRNLTGEQFNRLFKRSPVLRRSYEQFMRNVKCVLK